MQSKNHLGCLETSRYNESESYGAFTLRLLKKYPNRRIYDTQTSQFVTLSDIREMVNERQVFQVIHSKTGNDLTRSVLMQIITEMEAEGHESLLTNRILEELIRFFDDKMVAVMSPHLEQLILQSLTVQDQLREQFKSAFAQPYPSPEEAIKKMMDQYQELTGQKPPFGNVPDSEPDKDT
jgi:polyhydroxyalkanoate synthesis repressor PhaR